MQPETKISVFIVKHSH